MGEESAAQRLCSLCVRAESLLDLVEKGRHIGIIDLDGDRIDEVGNRVRVFFFT